MVEFVDVLAPYLTIIAVVGILVFHKQFSKLINRLADFFPHEIQIVFIFDLQSSGHGSHT
jgi:hypothetical protein